MRQIKSVFLLFGLLISVITLTAQPQTGKTYYVKMATGNLYLRPANGEALDRVLLHIDNKTSSNREDFRWQLLDAGGGWYYLIHEDSGLAMDVRNGRGVAGNDLWLWSRNGGDAQKFRLIDTPGSDSYKLVSKLNPDLRIGAAWDDGHLVSLQADNRMGLQYWAFENALETDLGGPIPNISRSYTNGDMDIFLKRVGETDVYGLLETRDYALVMKGEIQSVSSPGIVNLSMNYYAVPKGDGRPRIAGRTNYYSALKIFDDGRRLNITQVKDGFRSEHALVATSTPVRIPARRDAGFQSDRGEGLTGLWWGNDGGRYYLHQLTPNQMIWFAEHEDRPPHFANILFGSWSDRGLAPPSDLSTRREREYIIGGRWMDLSKGRTDGSGEVAFRGNSNVLRKMSGDGYGATRLVRGRYLTVDIKRLVAKTKDACGGMDFYGRVQIKNHPRDFGVVTGNDIRPPWRFTSPWNESTPIEIMIALKDKDDGIRCGGGDDKVDINPQTGSDSDEQAFNLYLIVHANGDIFLKNKDGSRGRIVGQARLNTMDGDKTITMEGDITNETGFGSNVVASGASREECARIEFEVTWSYSRE